MKRLVIIAAVVLICQSAQVPQDATHQGQKPNAEVAMKVMPTEKPVIPAVVEMKRKTRAVTAPVQPEVNAGKPTVSSKVSKMGTKNDVMSNVTEIKRKSRAVKTTTQPEVKTVMPSVEKATTVQTVAPQLDKKVVGMTTVQPGKQPIMPAVAEIKRKTRAVMTTEQPEVKTAKPTEMKRKARAVPPSPQTETKADEMIAGTSKMQPESKTVMPTVIDMKRKTRAVLFTDNESHQSRSNYEAGTLKAIWTPKEQLNKMHTHRSMRSVKEEISTKVPVTTVIPVTVKEIVTVKPSDPASSQSTIDPCDLLCTKFEFEPICASNGLCLHEFPNQCILDTFNCKHSKGKFTATKDGSCQMSWLTKCEESDMI